MSCRKAAMDYLARREHSRLELTRKLASKEFTQSEISSTLDQLEQDQLLNDARFAEAYTQSRVNRGYGPVRIRQELQERGVAAGITDQVLEVWSGEWSGLAAKQQQKKFKNKAKDFTERSKQARFLQYRGFTAEQIWRILGD